MADYQAAQIPNDIIALDISGGSTAIRGDCIAIHFRVTAAGNVNMTGRSGSAAAVDVPFDTGTYSKAIRLAEIGPGSSGGATLDPANTVYLEIVGD